MAEPNAGRLARLALVAVPCLAAATIVVAALESLAGIPNASAVYLVAVVVTAYLTGTAGAVATAIGSFLLYNFLFTEPRLTFAIADPDVWLSVVLLLFVGVVVGQLAAVQRSRTEIALAREREARALFRLSRLLATRTSTAAALDEIAAVLRSESAMERVWITLSGPDASERVAADTGPGPPPVQALVSVLQRMPGDEPARWIRVRPPTPRSRRGSGREAFRVRIDVGPTSLGSIWALRARHREPPDRTATRLLAAAADQLGQALAQDRLRAEAEAAEIARRSDELKSALLQSVSHDLRTPLATIRAAAGSLQPGSGLGAADRQASAEAIDREVDYLNRLVTNLLDLSRIEAGALRAERDPFELDDVVGATLERLAPRLAGRSLEIDLGAPAVLADPVFVDAVVTNLVDNALKHTPPGTRIRVGASQTHPETVRLTVEDAGGGVPGEAFPRLFDKFYRVPGTATGSRAGTGIGLAVVFGLVEAMAGRVEARPSELGGLAIDVDLPAAEPSPVASPAGRVR